MPRERVLLQHLLELGPVTLEPYFGSLVLNDKTNRVLPKILHHLIYRKNKNRFRNENGQPNCFLSVPLPGEGQSKSLELLRRRPYASNTRVAAKLKIGVLVAAVLDLGE